MLDANGDLVRKLHFSPPGANDEHHFHQSAKHKAPGHPQPGINRLKWDLRYAPPKLIKLRTTPSTNPQVWNALRFLGKESRPITHWGIKQAEVGPLVAPGTYTVKVNVDGKSYSQPLKVLADPHAPATAAQTKATVKMLLHIRDDISSVSRDGQSH